MVSSNDNTEDTTEDTVRLDLVLCEDSLTPIFSISGIEISETVELPLIDRVTFLMGSSTDNATADEATVDEAVAEDAIADPLDFRDDPASFASKSKKEDTDDDFFFRRF